MYLKGRNFCENKISWEFISALAMKFHNAISLLGFYKFVEEPKTWSDASNHCNGLKGKLVTITSEMENSDLVKMMKAK